ncbi:MAG: PfkB family carbohydrate kinase [Actinomycetota bacterium]
MFCNDDEASALDVEAGGPAAAKLVVVKRGAQPVRLLCATRAEVPARSIASPVNTTGAGDAFAGGFLVALARGADPESAARAGHAAAAPVVLATGADPDRADRS